MTVRVLHVVEAIEAGVARHVRDLVVRVPGQHHVVVPPRRAGGFTDHAALTAMREAGADVHLTEMRRSPLDRRNLAAVLTVRRLIATVRPQVVHGHAAIGGAVARIAAAGTGAARVYTPNGLLPHRGAIALERGLGRLTDRLVAVSRSEAELARELRLARPERVTVIPNGIDLERSPGSPPDLRARLGVERSTPLVGSVGRLAEQKAPAVFVAACALLARSSTARFVLIGDGPQRELVAAAVQHAGLKDRFLLIPGIDDAAALMPQFDAFVLASRYEAGPYAPLEAMRAGTPVVLTDVVGNRDTVVGGETGSLVPPDSPGAIADAVGDLLADPALSARFAGAARERLAAQFDIEAMVASIERLYCELAADRYG